ncbi:DNA starvation/stationary phase protection protein [bacterium]|jgi:starvation-inducible DNA-binding protein|nr:DNA starvation/stationary phase protection protein [bacterium]
MEKVEALNKLLANHAIHYQRLRNFHWNVKGPLFYTLHQAFEDMYTKAALNVDTIAERILALGERPFSTYREFLKNSDFDETSNHLNAKRMVKAIIEDLDGLISQENKYHEVAEGDEATLNLLDNLIDTQEQDRWMLKAFLDE